ncbi:LOW QUALITY PROTEIN: interferon-inducible GTPase 5-like [Clarias gariepinus]
MSRDTEIQLKAAIEASGESTQYEANKKAQEQVYQLFNVSLNIAVTGETGTGKSSFVNAIGGLDDEDEGAAETGVTETTTEPTCYKHPTQPNVKIWDLPGIGTPKFEAKKYLQKVEFDKYDFFIIISSERFKENDIMLAKRIEQQKKLFYFVRSKIDNDLRAEETKKSFNKEETLKRIRNYCIENLKQTIKNPKVFLISSKDIKAFDFEKLVETLESDLPEIKISALLQSVPVSAMLNKKVQMFEKAAWAAAFCSGAIAVVPVPGLSVTCDAGILVSFFTNCYHSFGLDDKSIKRLSKRVNKPHLTSLKKSAFITALANKSALRLQLSALAGPGLVEYLCSMVPGVGSAVAALMSFKYTYKLLKNGLKDLENAALTVLTEAGLE